MSLSLVHIGAIKCPFAGPDRLALAVGLDGRQNSTQAHPTANS
jgi:hypothetical protein